MTGVVLCGGQSTRMGSDKGLMLQQRLTWAELAAAKLAKLDIPVVLSVNDQQHDTYSKLITDYKCLRDSDLQVGGPLKGIVSVHIQFPFEDLFVLACDMPAMEMPILSALQKERQSSKYDAYVFQNKTRVEPLCAIYAAEALRDVYEQYLSGRLKKHSMLSIIEALNTCYLRVAEQDEPFFKNYNSLSDLDHAQVQG